MAKIDYFTPDRTKMLEEDIIQRPTYFEQVQDFWKSVKVEGPFYVMIPGTLYNLWSIFISGKWMHKWSGWIVGYVNLYHRALQEMVEGHREVTKDHDTILEDGKSVKKKLEEFEEKLKSSTPDYEKLKEDSIKEWTKR